MIKIHSNTDTTQFKISTRLLMERALFNGYEVTYFSGGPSTAGITRCAKAGKEFFFRSTCGSLTPSYGVQAAENKTLTYSLLTAHGINMPEIVALSRTDSLDAGKALLEKYGEVVVKPSDANHGDGVTVGVTDGPGLEKAVEFARKSGSEITDTLVQRQVEGDEYRFLVVDGKVVAVAARRPPSVTGDGGSTIRELIELKNQDPRRGKGHSNELTYIDLKEVLHHRGRDFLDRVLKEGEKVNVLDTSNLSRGGESIDFTEVASTAHKKMAIAAAEHCFLGIAGVDLITQDVTSDKLSDSYIIEVNLTPGIRMHQYPTVGQRRDVAKIIFAAMEKSARHIGKPIKHIGKVEPVSFPDLGANKVSSRIDTGAAISSIWASRIKETEQGLSFVLFDKTSDLYTGKVITISDYGKRAVSSSMGHVQLRYQIKSSVVIAGRKIAATLTLADRSTQVYPVLIGRNVLKKKFIVDVSGGRPARAKERANRGRLDAMLEEGVA